MRNESSPFNIVTILTLAAIFLPNRTSSAADFHVGDTQPYFTIAAVPWQSLQPGDTVWIHWRADPYQEK